MNRDIASMPFFRPGAGTGAGAAAGMGAQAQIVPVDSFDWYISPAQRLTYESAFEKLALGSDRVSAADVETLPAAARASPSDMATALQLVDVHGDGELVLEQFVYLQHLLDQRRRTQKLPQGLPTSVTQKLASATRRSAAGASRSGGYVRPRQGSVLPGAADESEAELAREIQTLQARLAILEADAGRAEAAAVAPAVAGESLADKGLAENSAATAAVERDAERVEADAAKVEQQLTLIREYCELVERALADTADLGDPKSVAALQAALAAPQAVTGAGSGDAEAVGRQLAVRGAALEHELERLCRRLQADTEETRVALAKARLA